MRPTAPDYGSAPGLLIVTVALKWHYATSIMDLAAKNEVARRCETKDEFCRANGCLSETGDAHHRCNADARTDNHDAVCYLSGEDESLGDRYTEAGGH